MCELLALSFSRPICPDVVLRAFGQRSAGNPDGWGLAWYQDRALGMVKEPLPWSDSSLAHFFSTSAVVQAPIVLVHLREASPGGSPSLADTHPFTRELTGRDWCFAHNGTLVGFEGLPLGRFRPVGRTDSEYVFCHLLDQLAARPCLLDDAEGWDWLYRQFVAVNALGTFNALLSDGRRLFCYHDANSYKGLHFRPTRCRDARAWDFEDAGSAAVGHVIATCPLSIGGWRAFQPGELLVVEEGSVRFSSHRAVNDLSFAATPASSSASTTCKAPLTVKGAARE